MFIRRSHCYLLVLLLGCVLCVTPVRAHDGDDDPDDYPQSTAWLSLIVDSHGAATVFLAVPVADADRAQLQRAVSEAFSFPVQFYDDVAQSDSDDEERSAAWTTISARSPKAFFGSTKLTCQVDVQSIITQLRAQNIDHLRFRALFQNASAELNIEGAQKVLLRNGVSLDRYDAEFDKRTAALPAIKFSMGYGTGEIIKRTIPLLLFLLLPAVWTRLSIRLSGQRSAELWGHHLIFLNRLLTALWLIWLPVYALSGIGELVFYLLGPNQRNTAHVVNIAFYFVPPLAAIFLCHLASRDVYRLVPEVEWSPRDLVRHAIATTSFSMMPLFLAILAFNTFTREPLRAAGYATASYFGWLLVKQVVVKVWAPRIYELPGGELRTQIYDLGQQAGVLLQHIYVLPDDRPQLATAAARSDGSVMLSSSLVSHLSRREVNSIMAHEIGHVQASHPQAIRNTTWG